MSTARDERKETRSVTRLVTAILFTLAIGGYAISPEVKGASASVAATEEDEMMVRYLQSECAVDGLVFADCNLDF